MKKVMPDKVKEYCIELIGKRATQSLITSMRYNQFIVVRGPQTATGKSTLVDILRAIGYDRIYEEWEINTIQIDKPLTHRREKRDIFESLGIVSKEEKIEL